MSPKTKDVGTTTERSRSRPRAALHTDEPSPIAFPSFRGMISISGTLAAHAGPHSAHAVANHGVGRISLGARGYPASDGLPGAPLRPVAIYEMAGGTPQAEPPAVPEHSVAKGPIRGGPGFDPEAQRRAPRRDRRVARIQRREGVRPRSGEPADPRVHQARA